MVFYEFPVVKRTKRVMNIIIFKRLVVVVVFVVVLLFKRNENIFGTVHE